jgi:APA family basic amino acid/polyamine antiporter
MAAFLCGWTSFLVSYSAAIAWLGVSFAIYLSNFVSLSAVAQKLIGLALIATLAAINYRGVVLGATVQKLFTVAKIAGLAVLISGAFLTKPAEISTAIHFQFRWSDFGVAMIACLMTYDGWAAVASVAGEIRDPQRNIPRALAAGLGLCAVIYLAANAAFVHTLGLPALIASERPGADVATRAMGSLGGKLVTIVILLSIIGAVNGWLLTQPRVYFAQARDGLFFRKFGAVHPRFRTPAFSILMQFVWSSVLLLTGSFELLISYAMFAIWVFYGLSTAAVIVLRRTQPQRPRPYRMWGYPITAILFVATATWFLLNMLIEKPGPSLVAAAIIIAGAPAYFIWTRRSRIAERESAGMPAS